MITLVQFATAQGLGVTGTNVTLNGVTHGNLLVLLCSYIDLLGMAGPIVPNTPTDTNGTPLVASAPACQFNIDHAGAAIFHEGNATAGTHTWNFAPFAVSNTDYCEIALCEFATLQSSPLNQHTSNGSNAGGSTTTGNTGTTGALSQSNELVVAVVNLGNGNGLSNANISDPPAGYTSIWAVQDSSNFVGTEGCYKEAGSIAGQISTWTWSSDPTQHTWQAAIATFLEPTVASGGQWSRSCKMSRSRR